jgi:hypothetical protein
MAVVVVVVVVKLCVLMTCSSKLKHPKCVFLLASDFILVANPFRL